MNDTRPAQSGPRRGVMTRRTLLRFAIAGAAAGRFSACSKPNDAADSARGTVGIAAAANLVYAIEALNAAFLEMSPDARLKLTTGASGSLFAQIQHGAPYDVFLSADTEYPARLVAAGLGEGESLRTFATGRLVVWTTKPDLEVSDIRRAIEHPRVRKIAVAQPQTAPYGRAAEAVLHRLGTWERAHPKLVIGESIAQTVQFVETGNADLGFVALSLVHAGRLAGKGRWHEVPAELYASVPLDHAAVLTRHGAGNAGARRYLEFLGSNRAKTVLRDFGYSVP